MSLRIGVSTMIAGLSAPIWVFVAPFLGITGPELTQLAAMLGGIGELMFYSGVVLAGRKSWRIIRGEGWRKTPGILLRVMVHGEAAMPRSRSSHEAVPNFVSIAPPQASPYEAQARFLSVPPPRASSSRSAILA